MQQIDIEKFMLKLRMTMLREHPFYGHVLMQMPIVYTDDIDTFGVGKSSKSDILIKLYINKQYIHKISGICNIHRTYDHFYEVLKHEIHHMIFGHIMLKLEDRQRQIVACELSANSFVNRNMLATEYEGQKPGVFAEDYDLEPKLSALEYYRLLEHNKKFNEQKNVTMELVKKLIKAAQEQSQNAKNTGSDGATNETKDKQEKINKDTSEIGNSKNALPKDAMDEIEKAMDCQKEASKQLSKGNAQKASEEMKKAAEHLEKAIGKSVSIQIDTHDKWKDMEEDKLAEGMIKNIIRNAGEACSTSGRWGDLPGDVLAAIKLNSTISKPVIPWEIILKNFLASSSENILDYTMKRRSKRYGTRPGTKKDDVLNIAIGIDTSGSVSDDMLALFFNEIKWMQKTGTKITIFEWDTQVNREYPFSQFDGTVQGRGGTDPTDFLETVSERKFDCVITFTDLYFSPITKHYHMPMMWVADSNLYDDENCRNTVPDGIIMKMNQKRNGFDIVRR